MALRGHLNQAVDEVRRGWELYLALPRRVRQAHVCGKAVQGC